MTVTAEMVMIAIVIGKQVYDDTRKWWIARKRSSGRGLERAYRQTAMVTDSLYQLYHEIGKTEGFHSIRMLSVHNSGAVLTATMLWKGTVLATFPHDADGRHRWDEKPLDSEYITKVLDPVSRGDRRCLRRSELIPDGPLGTQYRGLGIEQSLLFLITKNDSEIVFGSVSFDTHEITNEQFEAIYACESQIHSKLKR